MGNTGSDKALPSAIPAADILEMIGGQAVIQYEVMPATVTEGAVVQYVGEDTTEYVSGSWYRGENGEWVLTSGGAGTMEAVETLINREDPVNVANTEYDRVMARGIYIGTTDMVDGVTELTSGVIYLVYS